MQLGHARALEPFTAGCSTDEPGGSSSRPQDAPEMSPSACCLLQMTQRR